MKTGGRSTSTSCAASSGPPRSSSPSTTPTTRPGYVPDEATFRELVALCDERGIRLFCDEVYRGIEVDPARTITQAADLSETAVSLNVASKSYGLPGLRVGWIACRDRALLERLEKRKHYTSICNAGPAEYLAAVALRHREAIWERNRGIVAANRPLFDDFFARWADLFDWQPPVGGCVCFPRYKGGDVEEFCRQLLDAEGVLVLPASMYASEIARRARWTTSASESAGSASKRASKPSTASCRAQN